MNSKEFFDTKLSNLRHKERNRARVVKEAAARGNACEDCKGPYEHRKFHWHHIDPSTKIWAISQMVSERRGIKQLEAELAKCAFLCSGCHKKRHRALTAG